MIKQFANGSKLLRFLPGDEPFHPADDPDTPLVWVQMIATHRGQYVLLHNHNRGQWELPGGGIEAGESCQEAAIRETLEETCQIVTQVRFRAMFKCLNVAGRQEYAALFTGDIEKLQPFVINNESDRICLWLPGQSLDAPMSEFSAYMIGLLENDSGRHSLHDNK
ncbi:MAG: NUDIX hydrolase [Anaerolineae bacterium]|nr:NUDIX hydrolase [Anaerolineae bacterium]